MWASPLPQEAHPRWRHRRRKLTEKVENRLEATPAFHLKTIWGQFALDPFCRRTRLLPSGIRRHDQHAHVPESGRLRGPGDTLCEAQSLVGTNAKFLELQPGATPGNRLRGDRRLVSLPQSRERRQGRLGPPQLLAAGGIQPPRAHA